MPEWLDFSNGAFTGTPPPKAGGHALCITVTAADASGATAVDTFHLTIAQPGALHASPAAGHPENVDDRCHLDDYQVETALIGVAAAAEIWI